MCTVTVLIGGKPEEVARLHVAAVKRDRLLERGLRVRGDDPVGGEHQRLAERSFAFSRVAIEAKRIAPRPHRVLEAPEPRIDRRDHLPAATILRIAREMRLHLRNEAVDGLRAAGSDKARRKRLIRQLGRAERKVKSGGTERQHDERDDRDDPPPPSLC